MPSAFDILKSSESFKKQNSLSFLGRNSQASCEDILSKIQSNQKEIEPLDSGMDRKTIAHLSPQRIK